MFECHACFRRYVRAVLSTTLPGHSITRVRVPQLARGAFQSTVAAPQNHEHGAPVNFSSNTAQAERTSNAQQEPLSPSTVIRKHNAPERPPPPQWKNPSQAKDKRKGIKSPSSKPKKAFTKSEGTSRRLTPGNIGTELKYLKDPLKLADHVQYVLEQDDSEKALALIRMSSKQTANTVSWNHMINWQMKKKRTKAALDTYNEMKKRGQKPDSYTYLLLLRGLADNAENTSALGKALSIYHSMSAPNSKVAANIIHTNAMLKVCARANDIDSIWDIASKLPENGPHAANSWTFTTILNSLRMQAVTIAPSGESAEAAAGRHEAAIVQGRQLWGPIMTRWRQGDLMLDEDLVCAMGRLLLIGARPRDWDDVLSLIQQSMNISRLVPRLGSASREEASVPRVRAPHTPKEFKNDASDIVDEFDDPRPGAEFDAFDSATPRTVGGAGPNSELSAHNAMAKRTPPRRGDGPAGYAQPGNNTLSLITEACLKMVAKQPAMDYWNLLTDRLAYAVIPDSASLHMLLRVLRQSRSSAEASDLLCDEMPRLRLRQLPKSFRIAMSTCVRDARNPHVLEHAGRILDAMHRALEDPDAKTLSMYVELAKEGDDAVKIARALERVEAAIGGLRSRVSFSERMNEVDRQAAMDVFKGMVGCYAKVLKIDAEGAAKGGRGGARMLEPRNRAIFMEKMQSLAAFVTRKVVDEKRKQRGPAGS